MSFLIRRLKLFLVLNKREFQKLMRKYMLMQKGKDKTIIWKSNTPLLTYTLV